MCTYLVRYIITFVVIITETGARELSRLAVKSKAKNRLIVPKRGFWLILWRSRYTGMSDLSNEH